MSLLPPSPDLWHALNLLRLRNYSPRSVLCAVVKHSTGDDFAGTPGELEDLIVRITGTWDEHDALIAGWKGFVQHALSAERKSLLFQNWRLLLATEPPEGFADFFKAAGEKGIPPGTVVTWLAARLAKMNARVPKERIVSLRTVRAKDLMVPRKLREVWAIEHDVKPPLPNSLAEIPLNEAIEELFGEQSSVNHKGPAGKLSDLLKFVSAVAQTPTPVFDDVEQQVIRFLHSAWKNGQRVVVADEVRRFLDGRGHPEAFHTVSERLKHHGLVEGIDLPEVRNAGPEPRERLIEAWKIHPKLADVALIETRDESRTLTVGSADQPATGEARDESQRNEPTVALAADASAFVAAKTLREARGMSASQCHKFLKAHPEIRQRKPNRKALEIHAGDWHKHWGKVEQLQGDALDDEGLQDAIADIEARKIETRKGKLT